MLAEYKTKTNLYVLGGLCLKVGGAMMTNNPDTALVGVLLQLVGIVLFIMGCRAYAMGKGHNPAWGWIGLLSCLGLLVLVILPDKHKEGAKQG